jgi:hypothetical protein
VKSATRAFWPEFVTQHWGRRPAVLNDAPGLPLAAPEIIFQALIAASERFRAGDPEILVRLVTEERFSLEPKASRPYLPAPEDRCAKDYVERITRKLRGVRFALVINDFPLFDAETWRRLRQFVGGLAREIPAHQSSFALFLGNYTQTPIGIHRDVSVFHFLIEGRKRIHTWPDGHFAPEAVQPITPDLEELKDQPAGRDYDRLLAEATSFEGVPGDVFFWPASTWHIGEWVDRFSMSLSLGLKPVHPEREARNRLLGHLAEPAESTATAVSLAALVRSNGLIGHAASRAVREARSVTRNPELETSLRESWLNRLTACGHRPVPPPLPRKRLKDEDLVRVDADFPIAWVTTADHELICSCGGRSLRIPADPRVERLLERLNRGAAEHVGDLVREHAGVTDVDGVRFVASKTALRTLLSKLRSLRAFADEDE